MGLGQILFVVVLLIFLSAFIFFLVKTFRAWGILHTLLLCVLFIESWVFLYMSAGVQFERVRATRDAARYQKEYQDALQQSKQLRFGSMDPEADPLEAVVSAQGMLDRITVDRGRVWRQFALADHQDQRIVLTPTAPKPADDQASADGGAAEGAAPAASLQPVNLPENLVVYCFEDRLTQEGYPVPIFYLGEYRVVSSDEASGRVTLESTLPLNPMHRARIEQGAASWTLYETMPIDNHIAFTASGSAPTDDAIFGTPDETEIRRMFEGLPEQTIASYLRDGQRANDDDRSDTIWEQVNLLQGFELDVDSDQSADASVSGYFDQIGRSIDIRLKRNASVNLVPDELRDNRIVVVESVARDLISRGVAERVQRVFVRPLNDYLGLFNLSLAKSFEYDEQTKYYKYQNELIDQANQVGQNMLVVRQKENQLLGADLQNYQKEIEFLNTATAETDSDLATLKQKLSNLYQAIHERHAQLAATGL